MKLAREVPPEPAGKTRPAYTGKDEEDVLMVFEEEEEEEEEGGERGEEIEDCREEASREARRARVRLTSCLCGDRHQYMYPLISSTVFWRRNKSQKEHIASYELRAMP